jgi:GMP synthase-like glutamine amidotransferase
MIVVVNNVINQSQAMYFPRIINYLRDHHVPYTIVKNITQFQRIPATSIRGIILSGSPLMIDQASIDVHPDQFLLNIMALGRMDTPILGICFGCQIMNHVYGGTLHRLDRLFCEDTALHDGKKPMDVRFCLQNVIDKVAPAFDIIASATVRGRTVPCFIKHKTRPLIGCLFHPEYHAATHTILDNFIRMCGM